MCAKEGYPTKMPKRNASLAEIQRSTVSIKKGNNGI